MSAKGPYARRMEMENQLEKTVSEKTGPYARRMEMENQIRVPLTLSDGTNLGDVTYETMKALSEGKNNVKARTSWEEETLGKYRQRQENAFAARNITGPLQYPSSDEIRKDAYERGVVGKTPGPAERKAIGGVALGLGPRDMDSYNRMLSLSQTDRQRQEDRKKDAQVLLGAAMQKQLNEERKIQGYADGKTKEEIQQDYAKAKAQQGGLNSKYWREEDAEAYRQEYEALDEEISLYRDAMRYKLAQEEREKNGAAAGQEAAKPMERASFGQWLGNNVMAGLSSVNKTISSTLDYVLPTDFLGKYDFVKKLNDYYTKSNEAYTTRAQQAGLSRGKGWKTSGDILSAVVAALPNMFLAFLSGGASIGAQAGVGLAGSAGGAASGASGILSSLGNSMQTMMRNPLYWTSVMQTLGTDYEEAKERGASDLAASASAILTTALNAGIEIGGGIETLPQGLRAGGKTAVEQWVRSMIDEGKEEVLQGITSNAMAKLLYDKDAPLVSLSDETAVINPVQSAAEFGAGAAVGGILGGGQVALNTGVNAGRMREMGKTLNDPDIVNAMIDTGIEYRSKDSQAYQFAQEARKKNGKLSNYEIGRLYNATGKFLNDPEIVDMMIETGLESPQDSRAYKLAKEASKKKGNLTEYEIGRLYRANVEQIRLEENRSVAQYEEEGQGSAAASEAEAARQTQNMTAPQVQRIPEGAVNPQGEELQSSAAWGETAQMEERAPQAQRVPEGTVDPQAQGGETSRSYDYDGRYGEATIDTPQAQAAVDFMDFAAARYGARFALYSDPDSKENGYYSGGVCHVNTAGDEPLYYTATHEFLHFFEDADPQGYQNLMGSVRNNMIRGKVWQQAMDRTMEDMRRRGENPQDYTQAQIFDITLKEKVSEIGTEVLKNPETFEKIAREDSNLAQRILEFLRGVVNRLRESVSTYFSRDVGQVRESVHSYEQLEKIYQKVLATSSARGELTERGTYRVRPAGETGAIVEMSNGITIQQDKTPFYSMGIDIQSNRFGESETIDPVLNNPKIERYSDAELENWKKSKSIVPYENERQFYKFVENARNNVDVHKKIYFGKLSDSISKQIFDRFGIDLSGYNIALKGYEIRKILLNSHGNSTRESLRGQEAITEKDLLNIPTIITEADDVVLSDRLYEGKPTLIFSKTIEGKNYVVAYTSTKHHDLAIQTMYKGKKRSLSPATNANALVSTSETTSGTTSNFSIPQNGGNVNTGDGELTERGTYRVKSADEAGEQTRYSMRRGVDDTQGVTAMRGADRESEYTWESLTQKPDMEITRLSQQLPYTEDGRLDRAAIKKKAIENVRAMGNPKNTENEQYVYCADVKQDIMVSARALSHGLGRKPGATALVEMNIGPVLANAIKVNELTPRENVQSAYELIGIAEDSQGNQYPTRIVVNQYKNAAAVVDEIELLDVVYAINAKKVKAAANTQTDSENPKLSLSPKLQEQSSLQSPTTSTISIADLLSIVKDHFPDGLSQPVLDQFGMQRPKGTLSDSAIYSMRRPDLDEMLSRAQVDMEAYEKADGELSQSFYRSWRNALYLKKRDLNFQRKNLDLVLEQTVMGEKKRAQLKGMRQALTGEMEEIERQTEVADKYEYLLNEDKVSHPERYIGKAAQQVKATPDGTDKTSRGRVKRLKTKAERKRLEIAGKIQDLEYALSTMDEGDPMRAQTVKNLERLRAQQAVNLKESEVAKIAEETLKQIDSIGTPNFEGMDSVVLDASDVGIYRFKSIYRNMQKIFGDDYALVYDQLLGPFDKSKGDAAKEARELLSEEYDYIVKKLGIKKGSREEKAVQWFGEGERNPDIKKESDRKALRAMGIQNIKNLDPNIRIPYTRDMLIQEFGEEEARKIRDAARWYRNVYDELFDQINEVRRRIYPNNPEKIMHKRKDYFRHFREMSEGLQGIANIFGTDANIDPKLAGISEYTRPKEKWASIKQERKGNATDEGAIEGFHDFLPQAMQAIYIDEHIDNFRAFAKLMADVKSQDDGNGDLNGFILYLNDFAEMLAGKTAPIDRALMKVFGNNDTGRKVLKALSWLDNRAKGNMIGGNISTILAQPSNMIGALAQIENPADSAKGFSDAWKDLCGDSAMRARSNESNFLSERYLEKSYDRFEKNGIIKGAGKLLGFSDEIGTRVSWHAYYNEGVRKGENPVEYADNMTRQAVAGRGIGEVPLGFQSKLGRFFFPFMIEVQNNWHVIGDILRKKQFDTPGKNGLNNAGRILAYFLMVYLFNSMTELMRGSKVAFDPIGDVAEGVEQGLKEGRTGGEKAKQAALRSVQNLAGDAISNSPFGTIGQIASGLSEETISNFTNDSLYPARGAVPGLGTAATAVGKFFGDESSRNPLGGAVDLITTYVTPFGGNQINKTIRGVSDYVHGGKYKNDIYKELQSGERGEKRYAIEKNIPNLLRSAAFGPSSLPESREYNEEYRLAQYEKERDKKEAQERMDDFIKEYKENPDSRVMEVYKETKRKDVFPYEDAPAVITVTSYDREFEVPFDRAAFQEDLLKRIQEKYEEVFRRLDYGKLSGEEKVAFFDKAKKEAVSDVKKGVTDGFKESDAEYKQWTKSEKAKRRSK